MLCRCRRRRAGNNRSTSGLPRRGKEFVPPATITLPPMLQSGGDVAFRETLYLMVLAFGRLHTCREAFGRSLGAHRFAVHRADRNRLPARQRGRVDPRACRPHPARRDACDHRGRPADRQGSADQTGQHARPPQRAGAAVAQGRGRDPRGQSAAAARQRPAVYRRVARGFRGACRASSKNSRSTANMRSRKSGAPSVERSEVSARRAGLNRPLCPCHPPRARSPSLAS